MDKLMLEEELSTTKSKLELYDSAIVRIRSYLEMDLEKMQKKMHFLLSSMSVVYVLTTPIPKDDGDDATVEQIKKGPSGTMMTMSAENYRIPWKPDIWLRMHQVRSSLFTQYKMNMDEATQVSCIIDKLPPFWKYFKHPSKHLKEELTLFELGSHLHIKESLGVHDSNKKKGNNVVGPLVVNMMEHNNSSRYNDNKGKRKHHDNTRDDPNKKAKPTCCKCGKTSHIKRDCKCVNVGNKAHGSGTKGSVLKGQNMFKKYLRVYYVTYVSKAYFVQDDDVVWWVNSGATVHVCKDRCWFKTYESLNDGFILPWEMSQQPWCMDMVV
nr:hypothetical protein [Tanacetum cinerariifolium]